MPEFEPRRIAARRRSVTLFAVAVLVSIAAACSTTSSSDVARPRTCAEESSTLGAALRSYRTAHGSYPTASQGLAALAADHRTATRPDPTRWAYDPGSGTIVGIGACESLAGATPRITGTLTVFAATSLTNAFNDIKAKLTAVNPSLHLVLSYDGSATLQTQIDTGTSPADVFAAADTSHAPTANLVGSSDLFASNTLEIITRPGNPAHVRGLADLFTPTVQVVLCQSTQPCGKAADRTFATIGTTRSAIPDLVSQTANVGLVVTGVTTGAPDTVGIVYVTDALAAGNAVTGVPIPAADNTTNHYPIHRITSGAHGAAAQQFINYLLGPDGRALLAARGFGGP